MGTLEAPENPDSKGCGAVMRSAPFGLLVGWEPQLIFQLAVECAAQTHGHPTGYLAAGAFAVISQLALGEDLDGAVQKALAHLATRPGHEETTGPQARARRRTAGHADARPRGVAGRGLDGRGGAGHRRVLRPGRRGIRHGLLLAVNHSGDSDSTGAICGNLLGTLHGETALPPTGWSSWRAGGRSSSWPTTSRWR